MIHINLASLEREQTEAQLPRTIISCGSPFSQKPTPPK